MYLRIKHKHLPGHVADADEGVDDVGAHVPGNVVNCVSADARPVNGPVAEVAHHAGLVIYGHNL